MCASFKHVLFYDPCREPFHVTSPTDSRSLSIPAGASATTPTFCIGVEHPTVRLFAVSSGSLLSALRVEVIYHDLLGQRRVAALPPLTASPTWQPTVPLALLANITSLNVAADNTTQISLRFSASPSSGNWKIDDVYVDPFKGR